MIDLSQYRTLVFDCDGVILDSNQVKTAAFYQSALPYGEDNAQFLVDYHRARGGVSRFEKFKFFIDSYLAIDDVNGVHMSSLLERYSSSVKIGLMKCPVADSLLKLRTRTMHASWMVVSGGKQDELRDIFAKRGLDRYFDAGVFGSPDSKDAILDREINSYSLALPALFIGDSRYDHEAATRAGLDFVFVSIWTEFSGWENYCQINGVQHVESLDCLVSGV